MTTTTTNKACPVGSHWLRGGHVISIVAAAGPRVLIVTDTGRKAWHYWREVTAGAVRLA